MFAAAWEQAGILEHRRLSARETERAPSALPLAGRFSAELPVRSATSAVGTRLDDLSIDDLASVSEEQWRLIQRNGTTAAPEPSVRSTSPLDERTRAKLQHAAGTRPGCPLAGRLGEDRTLIVGLRDDSGPPAFGSNLRDERAFFDRVG